MSQPCRLRCVGLCLRQKTSSSSLVRHPLGVVRHLDDLGVAGPVRAHVLVRRVLELAARVADARPRRRRRAAGTPPRRPRSSRRRTLPSSSLFLQSQRCRVDAVADARSDAARRGTRARGARRTRRTSPRCAPSRRSCPSPRRSRPRRRRVERRPAAAGVVLRVSSVNSSAPQPAQRYVPGSKTWSYSPVNGRSVPFSRSTRYCSGVSSARHCSSVFLIFSTLYGLASRLGRYGLGAALVGCSSKR